MTPRTYIAIDLKSFYASVECIDRGLDPLTANLVVADRARTSKTICLAVSPALKAYGIPGRARLFEVEQKVKEINAHRQQRVPGQKLTGSSCFAPELQNVPHLALDFIAAPPRMARYIEVSSQIYDIYLKYIAPEDIHVYSIDEVFIDATHYLNAKKQSAHELTRTILLDVLNTTGITAAAGIGTNLYLCKVAMDIVAKRTPPDAYGVRIAYLDEIAYRRLLWDHRPLTDFWRVGRGYARKLEANGLFTMGDIAKCSLQKPPYRPNEDMLYKLFGVNAELLIDHAWGWEPCTIADIKAYKPSTNSLGTGQVLHCPYTAEKARLVTREMTDLLVLDLVEKGLATNQLVLTVGYDTENLTNPNYTGPITVDFYGRRIPKHAHGTANLEEYTSSTHKILSAMTALFDRIVDPDLLVRRINISANHIIPKANIPLQSTMEQMDLFTDYTAAEQQQATEKNRLERETQMQQTMLQIRRRFGKNAILKGMNLEDGATARERNRQIGGHKA